MKPQLSDKAQKFKRMVSPVREIMNYADPKHMRKLGFEPSQVISFAGGWVNHQAPRELQEAYAEIAADGDLFHTSGAYSPTLGQLEAKEAIISYEKAIYDLSGLDAAQIVVGMGSTQLTSAAFQALLNPGDSILLLDPTYCNYSLQLITALDVDIIRFPVLDRDSWTYIADESIPQFREFILARKPKVILLVCPDNPTSQVLSNDFVRVARESVEEIGSFLVIDFAYKSIVFGEYPEYFSWGPSDNFLSIHSNSKWSKNLGRRLGWIEGPEFVVEGLESILNSTILCPDNMHQMAFARYVSKASLSGALNRYIGETSELYRQAAQATVRAVKEHLKFPVLEPQGGIYCVMAVDRDGAELVRDVLANTGVLFIPGWGFGRTLINGVRISYGPMVMDHARIEVGISKVARYLGI